MKRKLKVFGKRLTAGLLSLVMVFTMLPVAVFADTKGTIDSQLVGSVIEAEREPTETPVCSCEAAEGEAHAEDCPMYEAPAETPVCSCEAAEGEAHAEDCPMYEAPTETPVCSCEAAEGEAHAEDCPMYEAPAETPVCSCEAAEGEAHAENCPLYEAPSCDCERAEVGIHERDCHFYEASFYKTVEIDETKIIVNAEPGVLPEDAQMHVERIDDEEMLRQIEEAILAGYDAPMIIREIVPFDITFYVGGEAIHEDDCPIHIEFTCECDKPNGKHEKFCPAIVEPVCNCNVSYEEIIEIQPDNEAGMLSVTFRDLADDADPDESLASKPEVAVFHVDLEAETAEMMESTVELNKVTFEAEHFSIYTKVTLEEAFAGGKGTEADPYILNTATHLDNLAYLVNNTSYTFQGEYLKVTADIDLSELSDTEGTAFEWSPVGSSYTVALCGTLDGDGHTISGWKITASDAQYVGFFGYLYNGAAIKNLTLKGDITIDNTTTRYVGGLAGYNSTAKLENCHFIGDINTKGAGYVGGLVGENYNATVSHTTYKGTITADYYSAQVGAFYGSMNYGTTESCIAEATIEASAAQYVGGLIGYFNNGNLKGCVSAVDIDTTCSYTGGFAGRTGWNAVTSNCLYFDADNTAILPVGSAQGSVTNCYYHAKTEVAGAGITYVDADKVKSAEMAYIMDNGDSSDRTKAWATGEKYPIFADNDNPAIYKVVLPNTIAHGSIAFKEQEATVRSMYVPYGTPVELTISAELGGHTPECALNITPECSCEAAEGEEHTTECAINATRVCNCDPQSRNYLLKSLVVTDATGNKLGSVGATAVDNSPESFVITADMAAAAAGVLSVSAEFMLSPSAPTYKVTKYYNYEGADPTSVEEQVAPFSKIGDVTELTRQNYAFKGWYKEAGLNNRVDEDDLILADIDLYAKWEFNGTVVRFDNAGYGVKPEDQTLVGGLDVLATNPGDPVRTANDWETINFLGWQRWTLKDGSDWEYEWRSWDFSKSLSENGVTELGQTITLTAKWEVVNAFTTTTKDAPYVITTAKALRELIVNDTYPDGTYNGWYELGNDIDLSDLKDDGEERYDWDNRDGDEGHKYQSMFYGNLDGKGHKVTGLYMSQEPSDSNDVRTYRGLFCYLANATVKNLTVEGEIYDLAEESGSTVYMGGIAGMSSNSTIENCTSLVKFTNLRTAEGVHKYSGAVVGRMVGGTMTGSIGWCEGGYPFGVAGTQSSNPAINNSIVYYNGTETPAWGETATADEFAGGRVAWMLGSDYYKQGEKYPIYNGGVSSPLYQVALSKISAEDTDSLTFEQISDKPAIITIGDSKYIYVSEMTNVKLIAETEGAFERVTLQAVPASVLTGDAATGYTVTVQESDVSVNYGPASAFTDELGWFKPGQDIYTIRTEAHLRGLAKLVNGISDKTYAELGFNEENISELGDGLVLTDKASAIAYAGKTFVIGNDIVITGGDWTAIGTETAPFSGKVQGGGNAISGLAIGTEGTPVSESYQGLFGYVKNTGSDPVFSDLTVEGSVYAGGDYVGGLAGKVEASKAASNVTANTNVSGKSYVGGIFGQTNGTLDGSIAHDGAIKGNSVTAGETITGGDYVGGIAGELTTAASNTSSIVNRGTVQGHGYVGGIAGKSYKLCNVVNYASVTAAADYAGGIAGYNNVGIYDSFNHGSVTSTGSYVGGLAGYGYGCFIGSNNSISDSDVLISANYGNVTGTDYVGGFIGSGARQNRTYPSVGTGTGTWINEGLITGRDYVGGFIGGKATANIGTNNMARVINKGDVTGRANVGGVIGEGDQGVGTSCSIQQGNTWVYNRINVVNEGNVTGSLKVGGVIGNMPSSQNVYGANTGLVTGVADPTNPTEYPGSYVGGIVGDSICNLYGTNHGTVTAAGDYVGGLAGIQKTRSNGQGINHGDITGHDYVGGIAGEMSSNGSIRFYDGWEMIVPPSVDHDFSVNGHSYVGGLAGKLDYNPNLSSNPINKTINVTATGDYAGGIAGHLTAGHELDGSFSGTVISTGNYAGGFVGLNEGTIKNASVTGKVTGTNAGGIAGAGNGAIKASIYYCEDSEAVKGAVPTETDMVLTDVYYLSDAALADDQGMAASKQDFSSGKIASALADTDPYAYWGLDPEVGYPEYSNSKFYVDGQHRKVYSVVLTSAADTIDDNNKVTIARTSSDEHPYDAVVTEDGGKKQYLYFNSWVACNAEAGNVYTLTVTKEAGKTVAFNPFNAVSVIGSGDSAEYKLTVDQSYDITWSIGSMSAADYEWFIGKESPYMLDSEADLVGLMNLVNGTSGKTKYELGLEAEDTHTPVGPIDFAGKVIKLQNDVAIQSVKWTPVGSYSSDSKQTPFKGMFDGQDHTISGYSVTEAKTTAGLFGFIIGEGSGVKNLTVNGVVSNGSHTGGVAGLAGAGASFEKITVKSQVSAEKGNVGGVVGAAAEDVTFTDCTIDAAASVSSNNNATNTPAPTGGVVGLAGPGTKFVSCVNNAKIFGASAAPQNIGSATNASVSSQSGGLGGIAGQARTENNRDITFTDCVNNGEINNTLVNTYSSYSGYTAGILGWIPNEYSAGTLTMTNCINNGKITGASQHSVAAGIISVSCAPVVMTKCVNNNSVFPSLTNYGVIAGVAAILTNYAELSECGNTADITFIGSNATNGGGTGAGAVGKLLFAASAEKPNKIKDCYNRGNIIYTGYAVGAGVVNDVIANGYAVFDGCYNEGDLVGAYAGVLYSAGSKYSSGGFTMINCYNSGKVKNDIGFAAGVANVLGSIVNLTGCYNTGDITGTYAAGVVREAYGNSNSVIDSCYNTGNVTGNVPEGTSEYGGWTGGVFALLNNANATRCYNTGKVTMNTETTGGYNNLSVGGVVGSLSGAKLHCSYNTGVLDVSAEKYTSTRKVYVGGVAGQTASSSSVTCSYNTGEIEKADTAGTLNVGAVSSGAGAVNNKVCYYLASAVESVKQLVTELADAAVSTAAAAKDFLSGKIAWLLDRNPDNGSDLGVWGQGANTPEFMTDAQGNPNAAVKPVHRAKVEIESCDCDACTATGKKGGTVKNGTEETEQDIYLVGSETAELTFTVEDGHVVKLASVKDVDGNVLASAGGVEEVGESLVHVSGITIPGGKDTYTSIRFAACDFSAEYTVTFDANGGLFPDDAQAKTQQVKGGRKASKPDMDPAIAVEDGQPQYQFMGWYLDANGLEKYDFNTAITENITLYAGFMLDGHGRVFFDVNRAEGAEGSAAPAVATVKNGELVPEPTDPTWVSPWHTYQRFVGWYTAREGGDKWNFEEDTFTGLVLRLYARWETTDMFVVHVNEDHSTTPTSESAPFVFETKTLSDGRELTINDLFVDFNHSIVNKGNTYKEKFFLLGDNVTLPNNWEGISRTLASEETLGNLSFAGTFDGGSNTVNLDGTSVGLFVNLGNGAVLKNIKLDGSMELGNNDGGSLANYGYYATIQNCQSSVDITFDSLVGGPNDCIGGLVASGFNSTFSGCSFSGSIRGGNIENHISIGGIAGAGRSFTNCTNNGTISIGDGVDSGLFVKAARVGGIVGTHSSVNTATEMTDCENSGSISTGKNVLVGGLIGANEHNNLSMTNCTNSGAVTSGHYAAGLIGAVNGTANAYSVFLFKAENCVNTGAINGDVAAGLFMNSNVGGLSLQLTNCTNGSVDNAQLGAVTGASGAAGITNILSRTSGNSTNNNLCTAEECTNYGPITLEGPSQLAPSYYRVGGIAGEIGDATMTYCYNYGEISAHHPGNGTENAYIYAGGIVGNIASGTVDKCRNEGDINVTSNNAANKMYAGGIVGDVNGGYAVGCYMLGGKITADNNVSAIGGIAGNIRIEKGVRNSYWYGESIFGAQKLGGVAGTYFNGNAVTEAALANAAVDCGYYAVGGLTDSGKVWQFSLEDMENYRAAALVDNGAEIWTQGLPPKVEYPHPIWGYPTYYPLIVEVSGRGTALANGKTELYLTGNGSEQVTISIVPEDGYRIASATITNVKEGTVQNVSNVPFIMPKSPVIVSVSFAEIWYGDGDGEGGGSGSGTGGVNGDGTGTGAGGTGTENAGGADQYDDDDDSILSGIGFEAEVDLREMIIQTWSSWQDSGVIVFADWTASSDKLLNSMMAGFVDSLAASARDSSDPDAVADARAILKDLNSRAGVNSADGNALVNALRSYVNANTSTPFMEWLSGEGNVLSAEAVEGMRKTYGGSLGETALDLYQQYYDSKSDLTFPQWLLSVEISAKVMAPAKEEAVSEPERVEEIAPPEEVPDGSQNPDSSEQTNAGGGGISAVWEVVTTTITENPVISLIVAVSLIAVIVMAALRRYRESKKQVK